MGTLLPSGEDALGGGCSHQADDDLSKDCITCGWVAAILTVSETSKPLKLYTLHISTSSNQKCVYVVLMIVDEFAHSTLMKIHFQFYECD